jgi:uncharacterized membrane protein YkoI
MGRLDVAGNVLDGFFQHCLKTALSGGPEGGGTAATAASPPKESTMKPVATLALLTATAAALGAGMALAGSAGQDNDAVRDLAGARIGIEQAIQTAQTATGGRATSAELDGEHGRVLYLIEVVTPKHGVLDVSVDAGTGKLLAQRADRADGKDEADETDRD